MLDGENRAAAERLVACLCARQLAEQASRVASLLGQSMDRPTDRPAGRKTGPSVRRLAEPLSGARLPSIYKVVTSGVDPTCVRHDSRADRGALQACVAEGETTDVGERARHCPSFRLAVRRALGVAHY